MVPCWYGHQISCLILEGNYKLCIICFIWRTCQGKPVIAFILTADILFLCKARPQQRAQCVSFHSVYVKRSMIVYQPRYARQKTGAHHIRKISRSKKLYFYHTCSCLSLLAWSYKDSLKCLQIFQRTSLLLGLGGSVTGSKLRPPWEQRGPLCQRQSSL